MINKLRILPQLFLAEANKKEIAGFIALSIALVTGSLTPILIKFSENEISPIATIFNRLWINTLVFSLWFGLERVSQKFSERKPEQPEQQKTYTTQVVKLLLLAGIFSALQQIIWAWSLTQTTVANSSLMHSMTPLFTTLGGWIVFSQSYDRKFLLGLGISIVGILCLEVGDFSVDINQFQGDASALLAALFYGFCLLTIEQLRPKLNTQTIVFWSCVLGMVLILPILILIKDSIFPHSYAGWIAIISLGLSRTLVFMLLVYSLNHLSSALVAIILLLDPILASVGGFAFFSEIPSFLDSIAFLLVLLGLYFSVSSKSAVKT